MSLSQKQCMRILIWIVAVDIVLGVTLVALGLSSLVVKIIQAVWR